MVFPWGPCGRVWEQTGSDAHEVRECRIFVWFAPACEKSTGGAAWAMGQTRSMRVVVTRRLSQKAEATTR